MASFKDTFSRPETAALTVTTDPASRLFGGALKIASLATLAAVVISAAPILPVAGLALAGYAVGAAAHANAIETTKPSGQQASFSQKLARTFFKP